MLSPSYLNWCHWGHIQCATLWVLTDIKNEVTCLFNFAESIHSGSNRRLYINDSVFFQNVDDDVQLRIPSGLGLFLKYIHYYYSTPS